MTPYEQVRELVRKESLTWVMSPNAMSGWCLWEDDRLHGVYPTAKAVCEARRRVIMMNVWAELNERGINTDGNPKIKQVLAQHPDRSVEHALRDYIVERITETVLMRLEQ